MEFIFLVFTLILPCIALDSLDFQIGNFTLEDNDYKLTEIENDTDYIWDVGEAAGRIIGGTIATPNQFPYQAGILLRLPKKRAWCGGSIISVEYILTAAHCIDE